VLAAVLVGGLAGWNVVNAAPRYSTAVGETRRLSFDDGSVVILDSDSELRAKLRPARRDFRLARGRAHFEVAKDPNRPFVVAAGDRQVFALGTVFDVARSETSTSVVLIEGKVAVQSTDLLAGPGTPRVMSPGERLTLSDDGSTQEDRPNLIKLTAWQSSQAVFDNDTMDAAVAELNRYSRRPIVISDPGVGRLRVSGVFRAGATQDFAVSVSALLPIRVRAEQDRIVIEARAPTS
jgi:transmembrane sensor